MEKKDITTREWSTNNLPDETLDDLINYLKQLMYLIKIAVQGFKAQMMNAQGYEPDLIGGSPQDNNPFQTPAEIKAAMRPSYGKDAAYTQSVYARSSSDVVSG